MRLKHFATLIVIPLALTVALPEFRGSFDEVAPPTIYGLVALWKTKDKDDDNGKRHS